RRALGAPGSPAPPGSPGAPGPAGAPVVPEPSEARRQLGTSSDQPAWTATAATALPAPAPAPRTQVGGEVARNKADSARMTIRPGTMNAAPPASAPSLPRTRHAHKIANSVEAGPGSRLQTAIASSNSAASSHRRSSTHSLRSSAIWAGGPPKPMHPIRPHSRTTVRKLAGKPAAGRAGSVVPTTPDYALLARPPLAVLPDCRASVIAAPCAPEGACAAAVLRSR